MVRYQGVRDDNGIATVWITTESGVHGTLPLRLDLANHSPTGFEWGYSGSGPRQLALALLAHSTGRDEVALQFSNDFKSRVVGRLNHNGWDMSKQDVLDALQGLMTQFVRELPNHEGILDADAIRIRHNEEPDPLEL